MKILKILSAIAAAIPLSGCVAVGSLGGGYAKAYEGSELKDAELAILYTPKADGRPMAFAGKVDEQTVGDDYLKGYPMVTKVLPGQHRIYMKCNLNTQYAFTTVTRDFRAGRYYEMTCRNLGTGKVGFDIIDRGSENPMPTGK
jgi:hypothetical protein